MNKTSFSLVVFLCLSVVAFAQQVSQSIQDQMNAAGLLQSKSSAAALKTPLDAFQSYYDFWKGADAKGMFYSYTAEFQASQLEGNPVPSTQDFDAIKAKLLQDGYSNFQIIYFVYTSDLQKPKINVTISAVDSKQNTHKEQMEFTFIDTDAGWKICDFKTSESL